MGDHSICFRILQVTTKDKSRKPRVITKINDSKTGSGMAFANGTRVSRRPIGRAITKYRHLRNVAATKVRYPHEKCANSELILSNIPHAIKGRICAGDRRVQVDYCSFVRRAFRTCSKLGVRRKRGD